MYAASASAYGNASDPAGQGEDTPLMALSPYAAAKLAGEYYAEAFAHTYGLETVRLRFFNVFGPRQRADSPYSGVIAIFAALLAAGRTPTIHGDGLQSRDFVYVADVAKALLLAAETPNVSGRVYNVGTGTSVNLLQLITELNAILGTSAVPVHGPPRAGDVRHSREDRPHPRRGSATCRPSRSPRVFAARWNGTTQRGCDCATMPGFRSPRSP